MCSRLGVGAESRHACDAGEKCTAGALAAVDVQFTGQGVMESRLGSSAAFVTRGTILRGTDDLHPTRFT